MPYKQGGLVGGAKITNLCSVSVIYRVPGVLGLAVMLLVMGMRRMRRWYDLSVLKTVIAGGHP